MLLVVALLCDSVARGALVGSAGEGRIASATRADLAEAAAVVPTSEGQGAGHELTGDTAWSLPQLAAEASAVSGRDVTCHDLPSEEYAQLLTGAGLPGFLVELLVDADTKVTQGALSTVTGDPAALLGRPATPLTDAVTAALKG